GRRDLPLQGGRPHRPSAEGGDRGRLQAGRHRAAQAARAHGHGRRGEALRPLHGDRAALAHQGGRPHRHDAPARDHGVVGHDAPALVPRPRGPDREQEAQAGRRGGPREHRGRPPALRRPREAPQGLRPALRLDGPRRRGRRRARGVPRPHGRPAREGRLPPPPGQERDDVPDRRPLVRGHRPLRPHHLHRPGLRGRLRGLRRRAADDHPGDDDHVGHRQELLVGDHPRDGRRHRRLQEVAPVRDGPAALGRLPPQAAVQDRRHRPEDRAGPLVAHLLRALRRGRADHAGDRGHGPDGRQPRRREGHGGRHRVRQDRWLHRRAAARGVDLPGHGLPDGRRGRGDRRPGHHALQGRGLLRGRGRRGGQGPHVDPRADHDRLRRRHRGLRRHRDVHADVQDVRPDPI
ncbi:MAG: Type IV fimbrial assembly protein PilC, partial [uncultured Solirubrobacteraceae bacterium]